MANVNDLLQQALLPESSADLIDPGVNPMGKAPALTHDQQVAQDKNNALGFAMADAPVMDEKAGWTPPIQTKTAALNRNASNKQSSVAATADAKRQAMMTPAEYFNNAVGMSTGQGAESASELENDLRNLSRFGMIQKYGNAVAQEQMGGQAQGMRQENQVETVGQRTRLEQFDDLNVDVASGLTGVVGGVAALGAGLASDELGTDLASKTAQALDFFASEQTPNLQARKRLVEAKNALDNRDTAKAYTEQLEANALKQAEEATVVGDQSKTRQSIRDGAAGLTRVLSDLGNAVMNATDDSATFGSGVANALGSFVGVGPVARGLSALSKGALGTTAAIAATESGGSYQQAAAEIMDRDHDTLMKESPMYRSLIERGDSPESAKQAVANQTGLLAASITAPVAAATGRLVSKFEGNPLGLGSGKEALRNIGKETLEESIQSGAGQMAQNFAESQVANTNKDLTEGVGRAIGEGGLYGMGMASALAIPSAVKSAGGKVVDTIAERAAGVEEANKAASPVADATVTQAATDIQASAPQAEAVLRDAVAAAPAAQQAEANSYVDQLMAANNYDPVAEAAPEMFRESLGDVTNRVGAIQRMAEIVNATEDGSPEQLRAGFYLNTLVQDYTDLINTDPEALSALPADNQAAQIVAQYQNLMGAITNTPKVMGAIETVMAAIEKAEAKKATVDAQTLATPEGQQDVADAIGTAELAPEKGDLSTNEQILYQIAQGNLTVTPRQKAALDTSVALLRAVQAADLEAQRLGTSDPVSLNISSVDGEKGKSVTQHAKGIMSAWKAGDRELAANRLTDLGTFAEGMANKVDALNAHFAAGNPKGDGLRYGITVNGVPQMSKTKMAVRTGNANSVAFAQKVAGEAKLLADVYNGLVDAFPDLGGKHLAVAPLDSQLVGPAADVVARLATPAPVVSQEDTTSTLPVENVPAASTTPVQPKAEVASAQKAEPAPVVAETEPVNAKSVTEPTVEQAPAVAEPAPKGMAAAYPQLLSTVPNFFLTAFKLPTKQRTRTIGSETPIADLQAALSNSASFTAFLGSSPKGEFTQEIASAYKTYLGMAKDFVGELDDNLQAFLQKKNMLDRVLNGEEANRYVDGKALNITEQSDGTLVYNPELIETAVLAGLQWFLNSDQYGTIMDGKDIAEFLGMTETTVSDDVVTRLNQGMSVTEATRSLAQKVKSYWGVQNDSNGAIGYQEGIPEAIAKEIIRVMQDGNWLITDRIELTEKDGLPVGQVRTIDRLIPNKGEGSPLGKDSVLPQLPSAIEQAVLLEPEEVTYIGEGNLPPVATDQLRNPGVKNTAQQLEAIKNEQATPYYVDPHMAGFYMALGQDAVLKMFGAGAIDQKSMNKNHADSMEGVNRSTVAAFNHLQELLGQVGNMGEIDQTPIHYQFNMTRVARLQMLGKYNPQSNKLVREAILPTRTTLDLSTETGEGYKQFTLGLAQMLGVKVHKMSAARSRAKVETLLSGPLAQAVEALQNWNQGFDNSQVLNARPLSQSVIDTVIEGFKAAGEPLTPMGLHAVMDYARYKNADDKSAFSTSSYVEADGVTNGPINAMVLFTAGAFTANWVRNIAKGGLFFNRPGETVNSNVESGDDKDLYQATTDKLKGFVEAMRNQYKDNAQVTSQLNNLFYMMDEFLGGDLQFDGETLTLQRGIAKNPLTITIYGSGAGGIAAKMTKAIIDSIYERMSQVAEAQAQGSTSLAEAMFGPQSSSLEEAQAKLQRFATAYAGLTTLRAKMVDGELVFTGSKPTPPKQLDPVTFTLGKDQIEKMQSNMRYMFVDPMRSAIETTVGPELMMTAEILRQATQAQSIVLEHTFKAEVEAALAEKAKDPAWKKGDFLTTKELDAIYKKLEHLSPLVQTGTQDFYIAGSQVADLDLTDFARTLDGKLRTDAFVAGPRDAGVSGIPFMNIGTGDGQMMQNISTAPNAPTGTLKIFDGINLPLDQVESGSLVANKAVFDSWQGNPLAAVYQSFSNFMSDAKLIGMGDAQRLALSKALFGLQSEMMSEAEVIQAMTNLTGQLNTAQQEIEARHRVMNRVAISVDQMASASAPFTKNGDLPLVGTDAAAIADQLSGYYNIELARIRDEQPTRDVNEAFYDQGTPHETGVTVMSGADVGQLTDSLPENQRAVMAEIVNSLAAKDYNIVLGTVEQIAAYNAELGLPGASSIPSGEVQGYTDIGSRTIYLVNPSTETLVHELIHAATFEAVDAHYAGETNAAVPRIEAMMDQFIAQATELAQTSEQFNSVYNSALSAINGYLAAGNKAGALNEFMAWTLASESLARMASRTAVSKLARVKDKLIEAIKSLLGIKASAGKDLFSNLLFNSALLMHEQTKLSQRFNQSTLFQNSVYGDNDRLTAVNEALDKTIGRYLAEPPTKGKMLPEASYLKGVENGIRVAESFMAHGFVMNMQEASTFRTIVTALSTEAQIDPNSMAAAQQLYAHVMKNLSVESFMNGKTDDATRYYASQKFDVLSGKYLVASDAQGRSSLLPAFLALATVSEEFRAVLANIDLPKSAHNSAGTLDALLENTGNKAMDSLGRRMAGQDKLATNVTGAIDSLNVHMAKIINQRETYIDQMASKGQGVLDRANDLVVEGMEQLAAGLLKNAKRANKNAGNKLDRAVAGIGAGFAALIDNTAAEGVSQATMATINKTNMWNSVHTLINDLIGRTESNANVYDMIKAVRSVVQRTRQQYRENLPTLLNEKFSRELTAEESSAMHLGMGKTDIAALGDQALELLADPAKLTAAIKGLEKGLSPLHLKKAKQLAAYMVTGKAGANLLRNAEAVARLLGENQKGPMADVDTIDKLVSLYAVDALDAGTKGTIASLAQEEAEGMQFTLAYLTGQRAEEARKSTGLAKMNSYKGHIPSMLNEGVSMIVANDSEYSRLVSQSYQRVGNYNGSALERGLNRGYYFIPVAARGAFEQGILQNVVQTAGGVNVATGLSIGQTAGSITTQADVKALASRYLRDTGAEPLLPVYDEGGKVIAFERSLDADVMQQVLGEQDLTKAIGQWRGRQVEEGFAQAFNERLVDNLKAMYDKDLAESLDNQKQYVDVFATSDPVLKDAIKLMSQETIAYAKSVYGGDSFWVRKDQLNDAFGYRAASIGDAWTGNTRWSPVAQKTVRNLAVSILGNDAYKTLMNAEKTVQQVVSDAKVLIVVKSVVVPAVNLISNVFQLAARGVPLAHIAKTMPKKTAEVEAYTRSLVRRIEAEAELRAAHGDARTERKLKTEIQAINDSHKRMSIWPLIEAGEFTGISDAGMTRGEIALTSGRMQAYMESVVNKLPGKAKNFGRYALVTKDTALFQGLQKAVEYGDFLAKATLYDDLVNRKGLTSKEAIARITEEFVNYDRLSGRFRGAMENLGLLWFYNFKIRSTKVALSMIRNNPVHTLLASMTPAPTVFGTVGLPTEDNVLTKLFDGSLDRSIGPGQGIHSMLLNPWVNLTQ